MLDGIQKICFWFTNSNGSLWSQRSMQNRVLIQSFIYKIVPEVTPFHPHSNILETTVDE